MKALVFDNELKLTDNYEKPVPKAGEALVRVTLAGICNTDYEITKGYMGYVGILGHEAVGVVEEVNSLNATSIIVIVSVVVVFAAIVTLAIVFEVRRNKKIKNKEEDE